jgi:hypothetical protein
MRRIASRERSNQESHTNQNFNWQHWQKLKFHIIYTNRVPILRNATTRLTYKRLSKKVITIKKYIQKNHSRGT